MSDIILNDKQNKLIGNIYKTYLDDIAPLIVLLETLDGEYPVEIINEIRAIFTHLARCYYSNIVDVDAQIIAAQRHIKRCKLDCYKYCCVSYDDYIKRFEKLYKNVDLSTVDNGKFLKKYSKLYDKAVDAKTLAMRRDTMGIQVKFPDDDLNIRVNDENFKKYCEAICDDKLYDMYEDAFLKFSNCKQLIQDNIDYITELKRKATTKDIFSKIGYVAGLVGVALAIISLFLK